MKPRIAIFFNNFPLDRCNEVEGPKDPIREDDGSPRGVPVLIVQLVEVRRVEDHLEVKRVHLLNVSEEYNLVDHYFSINIKLDCYAVVIMSHHVLIANILNKICMPSVQMVKYRRDIASLSSRRVFYHLDPALVEDIL